MMTERISGDVSANCDRLFSKQKRFEHSRYRGLLRNILLSLSVGSWIAPVIVSAQAPNTVVQHSYDIPSGSLAEVLNRFARVSGITLSTTPEQTRDFNSPGLHGAYSVAEAFILLLANTQLQAVYQGGGAYTLQRVQQQSEKALPPVSVFALGNALGVQHGYLATHSSIATKTSKPLLETSQSVSVITREQIEDQGAQTVQQAMRYTPGIFTGQVGASKRYDYVVMRGFADNSVDNVYLDGLKTMGDSGTFSSMQVDPYFIERIDILKGPSSVLYGRSLPGGLVALSSKKPLYEDFREIEVGFGNMRQRNVGFDLSGAVDEEKRIAFRLVGVGRTADTQFDHTEEKRYAVAPTLAIDLSDETTLTLQGYLQREPDGGYHSGVPADGALFRHNGRYISRHFFDGEPGTDKFERDQNMFGYQLEHRFNETFSARQNVRYLDASVDMRQVYGYGWASPDGNELNRYYSSAREDLNAFIVDNMMQADFDTGAARHTLLAGLDYQWRKAKVDWHAAGASPIDAFNPVYGDNILTFYPEDNHTRRLKQTGLYLQDLIDLGRWRFSLGIRQDWVSVSDKNRISGDKTDNDWQKFTGRLGALYLFDNGIAPYVNYAESFNPNAYSDESGTPLKPTEGEQWEAGLKYQPPGSDSFYTASLFHIVQKNVASKEPQDNFYSSVGKIRSKGLELEAHSQLSDSLKLLASYTYTDIAYTKSLDGNQGNTPNQAPEHMAAIWGDYLLSGGPLDGVNLGAGVRYVGKTWADKENTRRVPSYTLVDLSISYDLSRIGMKGTKLRINANNVFDKDYVASCYSLDYCYFGEQRNVSATLNYQF